MILAQATEAATEVATNLATSPTEGYPAWLVGLLALIAFLTPIVPSVVSWIKMRTKVAQIEAAKAKAELERDAAIVGTEEAMKKHANGNALAMKETMKSEAADRGIDLAPHVERLTKKRPKAEE